LTPEHTATDKAAALFEMGRPHLAIPILRRALASGPDDPALLIWLARALQLSGYLRDALRTAELAVAADPEDASAHKVRAWVLFEHGQLHPAIDAAWSAVELDPWDPNALTTLAHYLSWAGEGDASAEISDRAVAQFPEDPEVWSARCASAWALGRLAAGERSARRALALDPMVAGYHNDLGWSLALQGKFQAAIPSFRRAGELEPPPAAPHLLNLAFCLRAVGDDAEAARVERLCLGTFVADVDQRLHESPTSSRLLWERGIWRRQQGRAEEALADFEDALLTAVTPAEELMAQRSLAVQEMSLGRDDEARRDAASLLRFAEINWLACSAVALVGWLTGDPGLARAALDTAGGLVEAPMFAAQAAGYAALAEGRWTSAVEMLELAKRRGVAHFTCCENAALALAYERLGDMKASRDAYTMAAWLAPQCVTVVRLRPTLAP
jgi:Flp pilus assembly protein TadD